MPYISDAIDVEGHWFMQGMDVMSQTCIKLHRTKVGELSTYALRNLHPAV